MIEKDVPRLIDTALPRALEPAGARAADLKRTLETVPALEMALAQCVDMLRAIDEYLSRIRPVLHVFRDVEPQVPAGVIKIVCHIGVLGSLVTNRMPQGGIEPPAYLADLSLRLSEIFDPVEQLENRFTTFDGLHRKVRRTLRIVDETLGRMVGPTDRPSGLSSAAAPGSRSS